MIREVKTIYEHRCDVCKHSVETLDPGIGHGAPLLHLAEIHRGDHLISRPSHVCRECAHKPLIEILKLLQQPHVPREDLLLWDEETPF